LVIKAERRRADAEAQAHRKGFAAALGDQDFALGGEILGDIDQERLRLVDVAQSHRAHRLHVVDQHLGAAR
jgi:hypothetical protein